MSRATRTRLGVAGVLSVVAATGVVAAAGATSPGYPRGQVIHFNTKQVTQAVNDDGDDSFGVGDIVVFSNDLFQDGVKVGEDGGTCAVVRAGLLQCAGTNTLPDGQISVQGLASPGEPFELAITGGTGRYSNARGQVFGRNTSATTMEIDLVLR